MKRLVVLFSMIACVLSFSACGNEEVYNSHVQQNVENAKLLAQGAVQVFADASNEETRTELQKYTNEEIGYMISQAYGQDGLNIEGYTFATALESYSSALEDIGGIVSVGEATAVVDDDEIIVRVAVDGQVKDAEAEFVLSNDMFLVVKSAALNPKASLGELMKKATLNTVIGMGTVFIVLILISLIISAFVLVSKFEAFIARRKEAKQRKKEEKRRKKEAKKNGTQITGIENAVAQIEDQEAVSGDEDDLELVAVIAAAIAASEGRTSTDGFIVRSIRRRA
jgi:Na+-transporting methylmalonyl-CoA/oxaloacetate decarboxylase gamma subunit